MRWSNLLALFMTASLEVGRLGFFSQASVTLARNLFQYGAVGDFDSAAAGLDGPHLLERSELESDAGAANAQPFGDSFMGELQIVYSCAVVKRQEPSSDSFRNMMTKIAGGEPRELV